MAFILKYYSFKENRSGSLSKDFGWAVDITSNDTKIKIVDGEAQILKDEPVTRTLTYTPKGQELTEITQKEFEALDVSDESALYKARREAHVYQIAKLQAQQNAKPLDTKEIAKRFAAVSKGPK